MAIFHLGAISQGGADGDKLPDPKPGWASE